jgi:hypothetical protein
MEAREQELNERDVRTVTGARSCSPRAASSALTTSSGGGIRRCGLRISSPGAVRAHRLGASTYWDVLADHVFETEVVTGC